GERGEERRAAQMCDPGSRLERLGNLGDHAVGHGQEHEVGVADGEVAADDSDRDTVSREARGERAADLAVADHGDRLEGHRRSSSSRIPGEPKSRRGPWARAPRYLSFLSFLLLSPPVSFALPSLPAAAV